MKDEEAQANEASVLLLHSERVELPAVDVGPVKVSMLEMLFQGQRQISSRGLQKPPALGRKGASVGSLQTQNGTLQHLAYRSMDGVTLENGPAVFSHLLQHLRLDAGIFQRDRAQCSEPFDHPFQQICFVKETLGLVQSSCSCNLLLLRLHRGRQRVYRSEDLRGHQLDTAEQSFQWLEHDGRHSVGEQQREAHHENDDNDEQGGVASSVRNIVGLEVELRLHPVGTRTDGVRVGGSSRSRPKFPRARSVIQEGPSYRVWKVVLVCKEALKP
mmetsp:Transcript_12167/g.33426  ORF Transcript_12167/g.33426 Transcript_12167/m.33426 type:complete len:272 (+) Transcript_12167:1001-1816(+)